MKRRVPKDVVIAVAIWAVVVCVALSLWLDPGCGKSLEFVGVTR